MRKAVIALSIACAGALAFADSAQWQTPWFTGIGSSASALGTLDAYNGAWKFPTDNTGVEFVISETDKKIAFDLDQGAEGLFTVGSDATITPTPPTATEKTAQKIYVKGVFTPCAATDLATGAEMNANSAQVGFAVVGPFEESEETVGENESVSTVEKYYYYAWIGTATAASENAVEDWVKVGECASTEAETELTITISYWQGNPKASFSVKNGTDDAVTKNDQVLTSTAVTAYKVSSVACTGSGTLSALNGETAVVVASVTSGETTEIFGTVEDAIAAATGTDNPVVVEANPSDTVNIANGQSIILDENGKTISKIDVKEGGTLKIALTDTEVAQGNGLTKSYTNITGDGTFTVTTSDGTKTVTTAKDASSGKYDITVDTADSVLNAIQFLSKNLIKNDDLANFRAYVKEHCATVYDGAESTTAKLQDELAKNGSNTLPYWQSYVLGIKPTLEVAVKYASSDTDTEKVTLSIPALKDNAAFGNYSVKITDGGSMTLSGESNPESTESPLSTLKLPMTSAAKYAITLVIE